MRELWSYTFDKKIDSATVGEDYFVVSSGSWLYVFMQNESWNKKMNTTFYRDPYSDVKISCMKANGKYIACGTNFMDGKLYVFKKDGKLLWSQQFATIASLGWRPEDVVAIGIGEDAIVAGTEFIQDYIYAYTLSRRRIFEQKVEGRVRDVYVGRNFIVGTEKKLYIFNRRGELVSEFQMPAEKVTEAGKLIIFSNKNRLYCIEDGKISWTMSFDEIKSLNYNGKIQIMCRNAIYMMSEDGEILEHIPVLEPLAISGERLLTKKDGKLIFNFLK